MLQPLEARHLEQGHPEVVMDVSKDLVPKNCPEMGGIEGQGSPWILCNMMKNSLVE